MKTIIFPTDFSENAFHALKWAFNLAKKNKRNLLIIHAYHMPAYVSATVSLKLDDKLKSDCDRDLNKLLKRIEDSDQFEGSEEMVIDVKGYHELPVDAVDAAVNEYDASVIVMGTKGASGLEEVLLGSVASSVIVNSKIPVLVVPENAKFKEFRKALMAVSLREEELVVMTRVLDRMAEQNVALEMLYISESLSDDSAKIEAFEKKVKEIANGKSVRLVVKEDDDVHEGINAYVDESNPDYVITITRNRSFLEKLFEKSMTKKIAFHTEIPLLVFHSD